MKCILAYARFVLNQTVEKLNFSHEVAGIAMGINMQEC